MDQHILKERRVASEVQTQSAYSNVAIYFIAPNVSKFESMDDEFMDGGQFATF